MANTPSLTSLVDPQCVIVWTGDLSMPFGFLPVSGLASTVSGILLAARQIITLDVTINLNASLLTGVQKVDTAVTGLLTSDIILQLNPVADLPASIGIAWARIPSAGSLRVAFTTPVIYTGNTNIAMKLAVFRVLP